MTSVLARLRELAEHATPLPWKKSARGTSAMLDAGGFGHTVANPADADFIVVARALWLPALDVIESASEISADDMSQPDYALSFIERENANERLAAALSAFEGAAAKEVQP